MVENLIIGLMSDVTLQVRQKATKILCGLFHSQFIDSAGQKRLLAAFRAKIRRKMTKKSDKKFKREKVKKLDSLDKSELALYHSGILGNFHLFFFSRFEFDLDLLCYSIKIYVYGFRLRDIISFFFRSKLRMSF